MPLYLSRFSYTPKTWSQLIENPEDRRAAATTYIEAVGGKLHGFWYAFGSHDAYNLWEAPDNVSMACGACDQRWRRSELLRDDRASDRRRNDGCAAESQRDSIPPTWGKLVQPPASSVVMRRARWDAFRSWRGGGRGRRA